LDEFQPSQALGALVKASPSSAHHILGSTISLLDQAADSFTAVPAGASSAAAGSSAVLSRIAHVHGTAAALSSLLVSSAR
jgi:hypothetical protein